MNNAYSEVPNEKKRFQNTDFAKLWVGKPITVTLDGPVRTLVLKHEQARYKEYYLVCNHHAQLDEGNDAGDQDDASGVDGNGNHKRKREEPNVNGQDPEVIEAALKERRAVLDARRQDRADGRTYKPLSP